MPRRPHIDSKSTYSLSHEGQWYSIDRKRSGQKKDAGVENMIGMEIVKI
jgi:hypothetical protein